MAYANVINPSYLENAPDLGQLWKMVVECIETAGNYLSPILPKTTATAHYFLVPVFFAFLAMILKFLISKKHNRQNMLQACRKHREMLDILNNQDNNDQRTSPPKDVDTVTPRKELPEKYGDDVETTIYEVVMNKAKIAGSEYFNENIQEVMAMVDAYDLDVNKKLHEGLTIFLCGCMSGCNELVEFLLERGGDVSVEDDAGDTALYLAVFALAFNSEPDQLIKTQILETLLEAGCMVNDVNGTGNTPLHVAAMQGDTFTIKTLLDYGADPSIANFSHILPYAQALNAGHEEAAELLKIANKPSTADFTNQDNKPSPYPSQDKASSFFKPPQPSPAEKEKVKKKIFSRATKKKFRV